MGDTLGELRLAMGVGGRVLGVLKGEPAIPFLSALPLAVAAGIISWPVAITGAAAITLAVALWLGIWRPTLRRLEE